MGSRAYVTGALAGGQAAANAGASAAQGGINAILGGKSQIDNSVANMNAQAANVVEQANKVNATANEAKGVFDKLSSTASLLGDYGTTMFGEGSKLSTQAQSLLGQGAALMNLDPNAGGLVGEFVKYWNSLSPDRLVSQAASDTQASFQNAQGQLARDLSRRGVSASSGAYANLQKQASLALATALSAAKTKAREAGLAAQSTQLEKMLTAANQTIAQGAQLENSALNAMGAGASAQSQSASVSEQQASGLSQVAQLQASAAQLFGSAANIYGASGQLNNQFLSNLQSAYANLATTQEQAANYYNGMINALNGAVKLGF